MVAFPIYSLLILLGLVMILPRLTLSLLTVYIIVKIIEINKALNVYYEIKDKIAIARGYQARLLLEQERMEFFMPVSNKLEK